MTGRPRSRSRTLARVPVLVLLGAVLLASPTQTTGADAPPETDAFAPETVVTLTFDDGMRSHARVARILTRQGLPGTFFVNTGALGLPQYLEADEVRAIQDAGHEVGGHTIGHRNLTSLDPKDLSRVVCADRRALDGLGVVATSFAYPYGAWSEAAADAVGECGYATARLSSGLREAAACTDCPWTETWPGIDHRYDVRTPGTVRVTATAEDLQAGVLRAESVGGWWPLVFHRVCGPCERPALAGAEFRAFVRWLAQRPTSTHVLTFGEAVAEGDAREAAAAAPSASPAPRTTFSVDARDPRAGTDAGTTTEASRDVVTIGGVDIDQTRVILFAVVVSLVLILGYRLSQRGRRHGT